MLRWPLLPREHRIEALGIEVAIIDLMTGFPERIGRGAVQRRDEARLDGVGEEDEDAPSQTWMLATTHP